MTDPSHSAASFKLDARGTRSAARASTFVSAPLRRAVGVALAVALGLLSGCDGRSRPPADGRAGPTTARSEDAGGAASGEPASPPAPASVSARSHAAYSCAPCDGGTAAEACASAAAPGCAPSTPPADGVERPYALPEPIAVAAPPNPPIRLATGGKQAASGKAGVVASVEAHATRIGIRVLERGGNAVDAAVAVAFALAVTHPQAGSLGGGGFMVVRPAAGPTLAVDYRETSPAAAGAETNRKMLAAGARGYASAPVPGVVAGLALAHERYGSLPWRELVEPAVALAKEGHPFGPRQAQVLGWHWKQIKDPTFRAIFGRAGTQLGEGQKLRQPALAATLQAIAEQGRAGFYEGPTASRIEAAMKERGGYVRAADLAGYRALVREPLRVLYRGFEVQTMPPPSMGGIALATTLIQLEQAKAYEAPPDSVQGLHLFAEAARRSYADRRAVAGDPAFVDGAAVAPLLARLLDPRYHAARKPALDAGRATPSSAIVPIGAVGDEPAESPDTTHFSVVDGQGNAVACTTTLSGAFGAMVVPPETGVILSNALGAFSSSGVNAIAPGKRMASSMTPTLVLQQGQVVIVTGSPGGDTIPNTVAQMLRRLIDERAAVDEAVSAGRAHHQWKPDELRVEKWKPPAPAVLRELEQRGHKLTRYAPQGDAHSIVLDPSTRTAYAAADPRQGGLALAAAPSAPP